MTELSRAVFLSYASEDAGAAVRIAEALKAAGIEVWFDKSELRGGDAWDRRIRHQVSECRLFIPIVSRSTEARDEGYFRREWRLAVDRTLDMAEHKAFIVPVVVDETSERHATVPDAFRQVQWTRLPDGTPTSAFVDRIHALLQSRSAAPLRETVKTGAEAVPAPTAAGTPRPERRWRGATLAVAIGLSALAGAGVYFARTHLPWTGAAQAVSATERSIAVLPFVDMSEKRDQQYIADGIAEEVLTLLATIPDLKVVSRTSSFQFREKAADLRSVGRTLGAAFLVEGSVRRFGDQIRIDTQLVSAGDGTRLWSESHDSTLGNVLVTQREIATAIARELRVEVGSAGWPATRTATNVEAYGEYLRGLHALNRYDRSGLEEAVSRFGQALDLDPALLRARERLAQAHYLQMELGSVLPRIAAERLRKDTDDILRQDGRSVLGHALRAELLLTHDWDWAGAEQEATLAVTLGRNNSLALYAAADVAGVMGRWDESETLFRRSLDVDPFDADTHGLMGWTLYHAGRFSDAEAEDRRALAISPSRVLDHYNLGLALLAQRKADESRAAFEQEPLAGPRNTGLAMAFGALGMKAESDAALHAAEAEQGDEWAYFVACAHAIRGEPDAAFAWLDRAYAQRDYNLEYLKGEWALSSIMRDSRYKTFLRRMNLPD